MCDRREKEVSESEEDPVNSDTPENREKDKKKKKRIADIIYYLVMAVLVCVFLFAAFHVYIIRHNYDVAVNEYRELDKSVKISETDTPATGESESESKEEFFPFVKIDFDSLSSKNKEVIGWLYMPVLDISYPVTQGKDNDHYLHYTYDGTKNSSGSIFMDYESKSAMTDMNTFIYGHNMKNGSMFGRLKKFNQDSTLCDNDPYIYYFIDGTKYKYRIFAYYITTAGSTTYSNINDNEEYDKYVKYIASVNQYKTKVENKDRAKILTLSTCSGLHSNNRMIVQAILTATEKY